MTPSTANRLTTGRERFVNAPSHRFTWNGEYVQVPSRECNPPNARDCLR